MTMAPAVMDPAARPIGGIVPLRRLMITPPHPHIAVPASAAATPRRERESIATGPRLTISATPASPSRKPATWRPRSGSFSPHAANTAAHSGTVPLMTDR
jgi:hypothetical protein